MKPSQISTKRPVKYGHPGLFRVETFGGVARLHGMFFLTPSRWKEVKVEPHTFGGTWMSRWKLGSMVRINGLFHLLINGLYWG